MRCLPRNSASYLLAWIPLASSHCSTATIFPRDHGANRAHKERQGLKDRKALRERREKKETKVRKGFKENRVFKENQDHKGFKVRKVNKVSQERQRTLVHLFLCMITELSMTHFLPIDLI